MPASTAYPTKPLPPVIRIRGGDDIADNDMRPERASKTVIKLLIERMKSMLNVPSYNFSSPKIITVLLQ